MTLDVTANNVAKASRINFLRAIDRDELGPLMKYVAGETGLDIVGSDQQYRNFHQKTGTSEGIEDPGTLSYGGRMTRKMPFVIAEFGTFVSKESFSKLGGLEFMSAGKDEDEVPLEEKRLWVDVKQAVNAYFTPPQPPKEEWR